MGDKVRLGLIGAGAMANRVHYPSLAEMPDVEMVALCDLLEDKREETAAVFGIGSTYGDYRAMLDAEELDAVYVLMPPYHLFDVTMDAMERGLHIFMEKPPAVTAFQAQLLADAAAKHDVLSMVGFNRRFIPVLSQARLRLLRQSSITHCVSVFYKNNPQALYYRGAIDFLHCDAVHAVDMLRWMGGEVSEAASVTTSFGWQHENACHGLLRFESGASGVLMTNWVTGARTHVFEMHGPGVSVFCNPNGDTVVYDEASPEGETLSAQEVAGSDEDRVFYGFYHENRHFIDCIKAGQQPETCFADAAKSMALVDTLYANVI